MRFKLQSSLSREALGLLLACFATCVSAGSVRGFTRCAADLQLAFPMAGRIASAAVKEGSVVKLGTELMRLDRKAEELDVQRRHVQWQGQADLLVAQARYETAEKQMRAAQSIYDQNRGISLEELQNRELALRTTKAELERIKTTKATEWLDYLVANENLERRRVIAPTPGIITQLIKKPGESAQAYEAVLRMCDISHIEFMANISAEQSNALVEGLMVQISVGEKPIDLKARITFVSPIVDPASGLREIKAKLINPPSGVRPGQMASLRW